MFYILNTRGQGLPLEAANVDCLGSAAIEYDTYASVCELWKPHQKKFVSNHLRLPQFDENC